MAVALANSGMNLTRQPVTGLAVRCFGRTWNAARAKPAPGRLAGYPGC